MITRTTAGPVLPGTPPFVSEAPGAGHAAGRGPRDAHRRPRPSGHIMIFNAPTDDRRL
ncbi:hypothetical protein ABZ470_00615 [Streptosporangium sp. NPDC020072]|uniref:hypothetical protein n=1 Tax=Streptosporangium sp. NPDC020072 TaxID=3154788 RepID=UPI003419EB5A